MLRFLRSWFVNVTNFTYINSVKIGSGKQHKDRVNISDLRKDNLNIPGYNGTTFSQ